MAQEQDLNIDELGVIDSTHLMEEFYADTVIDNSGAGPNVIIIIAGLLVIASVVYFVFRKRKLKRSS